MFWNVASALYEISLRKWCDGTAQLRILEGALIAKLTAMFLFHSCFFTHSINQGWTNLFNARVICRKSKTPASRKNSFSVNTNMVKNASFILNNIQ